MQFFKNLFKPKPQAPDFKSLVKNGAVILDVRTKDEFKSGSIEGSMNIPLMELGGHLKELKRNEFPVIIVCQSGARSGMAFDILRQNAVNVYDGGGWRQLNALLKESA